MDEEENRIFGEIPYTKFADLLLKCGKSFSLSSLFYYKRNTSHLFTGCSRYYEHATKITNQNLYPTNRFRCMPDGNFDDLQCINDKCFCVNKIDGEPLTKDTVNISLIAEDNPACCTS